MSVSGSSSALVPAAAATPAAAPAIKAFLYICTPAYGARLTLRYVQCLMGLRVLCARRGIQTAVEMVGNESLITRARNLMVAKFLTLKEATHMMFIDADIAFDPEAVVAMIEADKGVICGIYPQKACDWKRAPSANPNEPRSYAMLNYNVNFRGGEAVQIEGGRFCRVLDAATGFMLMKREVLEKVRDAFPALTCVNDMRGPDGTPHDIPEYVAMFDTMICPMTRRYLSEDYAFSRRWQLLGGDIWVDLSVVLSHIGTVVYDAEMCGGGHAVPRDPLATGGTVAR